MITVEYPAYCALTGRTTYSSERYHGDAAITLEEITARGYRPESCIIRENDSRISAAELRDTAAAINAELAADTAFWTDYWKTFNAGAAGKIS